MATLHVQATSESGTRTCLQAGRHTFWIDEPPLFGGEDTAPSPVEMLLSALAGALVAIGRWTAMELDLKLGSLDISVDGDCDGGCFFGQSYDNRAGFQAIRVTITAETDAPAQQVARWKELVLRRCPVLDNLTAPVPVNISIDCTAPALHHR